MAGSIATFRGASPSRPIAAQAESDAGTTATLTLPNATADEAGSMRYSAVMSGEQVTSTFATGLTELCDEANGALFSSNVAVASAYEPVGPGPTPTRTVTRSRAASHTSQTYVLRPAGPCETGGLSLTPPGSIAFGSVALNGRDRTADTTLGLTVDDQSGIGAGWRLSITASAFTSANGSLPADAAQITGATPSALAGRCSAPSASVASFPLTLGSAPVVVANAAAGSGAGPTAYALGARLHVPSRARAGSYSSTWTLTLAAGP